MLQLPVDKPEWPINAPLVCRLCMLSVTDSCMEPNIFHSSESDGCSIADKIIRVTRLCLVEGDGLPITVCQQCIFQLDIADNFIQMCRTSNLCLLSKIVQEEHEISSDCNLETDPSDAFCNQPRLNPTSDDFLLALEYVESSKKADPCEKIPPQVTKLQEPTRKPTGEPTGGQENVLSDDNFREYSADLDEMGDLSLAMEEFGEVCFTDDDLDLGSFNTLIIAADSQPVNTDTPLLSVEKHSETPSKEITKANITGSSEDSYIHECTGKKVEPKLCTSVVAEVSETASSCGHASNISKMKRTDTKPSPSTIQQLEKSGPNVQPKSFPISTKSERLLLLSASSYVCDVCFSTFVSKPVLKVHKQSQACVRKHLKQRNKESNFFNKSNKSALVNQLISETNRKKRKDQMGQGAKVLLKTEPSLNSDTRFRCGECDLTYIRKINFVKHTKLKHQQSSVLSQKATQRCNT